MDNQRKWLDLSAAGFNLDHRLHVSGNFHIFVLTRIAGMKESSSIAQELVNAGFKAFPWGYSAKMTYGTASFLAQLPGAVRITLTQTEEASNDEHYPASDGRGSLTGDDRPIRGNGAQNPGRLEPDSAAEDGAGEEPGAVPSGVAEEGGRKGQRVDEPAGEGRSQQGGDQLPGDFAGRRNGADGSGADGSGGVDEALSAGEGELEGIEDTGEALQTTDYNPRHFFIEDFLEREGGFAPRTRFEENLTAIRCLQDLRRSGREANDADRTKLARYNGWGGLPGPFDPWKQDQDEWPDAATARGWADRASSELKAAITEEEWEAARSSINNAHYTGPAIIRAMWDAVKKMGFSGGRVLEPAMGVGSFFGLCPADLVPACRFHGVEKDLLSGELARAIYPDADIRIQGFEDCRFPKGFFDLVIGNVPFGDYKIYEKEYARYGLSIHDHFIVKSLDLAKPGGIVSVITSSYTLDRTNPKARRLMAERGELVGALRLPTTAHEAQAGTRTVTDVLFFVKRRAPKLASEGWPAWTETAEVEVPASWKGEEARGTIQLNNVFVEHPELVLGDLEETRGAQGRIVTGVKAIAPIAVALEGGVSSLFADWKNPFPAKPYNRAEVEEEKHNVQIDAELPEGSLILREGKIYRVLPSRIDAVETGFKGRDLEILSDAIRVREALDQVFRAEVEDRSDDELEEYRAALNEAYDRFFGKHGPLNLRRTRRLLVGDPACGRLMALEVFDVEKQKVLGKADIFHQRVIAPPQRVESVESPEEALAVSLNRHGKPIMDEIAGLCGRPQAEVENHLHAAGLIFPDPTSASWEIAAKYLSGNVREKLVEAERAAALDSLFERNVEALRAIQPQDLQPSEIYVRLGAPWVSASDVTDFVTDLMGLTWYEKRGLTIEYDTLESRWALKVERALRIQPAASLTYGTRRRDFFDILARALNHESLSVYDEIQLGDSVSRVLNTQETAAALEKLDAIQAKFRVFLWEDEERAERLLREYNDRYNSYVPPKYDGSHLTFPGMSMALTPRAAQRNAVWRALQENTLFNHEVGCGKTLVQVATILEGKRLGMWSKPFWCVPNHMLEQAEREARQLYPAARILAVSKDDLKGENRSRFLGRCANNNWDLVLLSHSLLHKIPVPREFELQQLCDELTAYRLALLESKETTGRRLTAKRMESKVKRLEAKIKAMQALPKEEGLTVAELGMDALLVDESHNFKNLAIEAPGEVQGGIEGSKRAWDLYIKTRWLYAQYGVRGVHFASGTPVSNNVLEIYNLQTYLQPQVLDQAQVGSPSAWAATFLTPITAFEPAPSGSGWRQRTRFGLVNIPELMRMLRQTMDVVTATDAGIIRPECERINVALPMSTNQIKLMRGLAKRVERMQIQRVDPREDNLLKIISEGRRLSLDTRLLRPDLPQDPEGKIEECARRVFAEYTASQEIRGTQLVFCDLGTPKPKSQGIYGELRKTFAKYGIPEKEVAFIHEAKTDTDKGELFRKVRSGSIRVLIGSTAKMGEGTNVQERIVAIHDMDPPWRATDIEQRGGRAERFGNINTKIRRYIYTVQDTFDTFMWHVLKHKAELFFRVLKGDPGIRELTLEVDPTFAETAAITSNNQLVREKLEVEQGIAKLEMRARAHLDKVHGARRLAAIFRGRRDEIQKQLHVYASLAPAESSKVWRFDLSNYGHSSTFKGSRDGLVKLLRKIVETQGLRVIKGMSCAGQPVTLKILPDKKDWVIGPVGAQIHRENASSVEKFFQDYEATVAKLKRDEESTEVQIADALAEAESKCDVDEELITLRARHREILAEIELESQKTLEIEGESLDADPAGVDWSDDLDESPSQTA